MTRHRFGLLLALAGLAVGAGSFALAWTVLDDGEPDPPPRSTSSGVLDDDGAAPGESTSTTGAATTPGALRSPTWVAVVASEADEVGAIATAEQVGAAGFPAGVLHSDDYASLASGFWVAYAGPYPDHRAAESAVDALAESGFEGAYARCVGTREACGTGGDEGDDDKGDGKGEGNGNSGGDGNGGGNGD